MKKKEGRLLISMGLLLMAAALLLVGYNRYADLRAESASAQSVLALEEMLRESGAEMPAMEEMLREGGAETPALEEMLRESGAETPTMQSDAAGVSPSVEKIADVQPGGIPADGAPQSEDTDADIPQPTEGISTPQPGEIIDGIAQGGTEAVASPQPAGEVEIPDHVLNPEMDMPVRFYGGQDYIGVLTIPSLKVKIPVISQWNYPRLRIAPCRYAGSAYTNDLVISGHNYSAHFGGLNRLRPGDSVVFTDMDGNAFGYRVELKETLSPTDVEEMTSGDWDLTLFTCTVGGSHRVTVRCKLNHEIMY